MRRTGWRLGEESYYERALRHPIAGRWHGSLVKMIRDLLPSGWERMKHLDLGCGGRLTVRMVRPEGEVFGVDIDSEMLEHAKSRGPRRKGQMLRISRCFQIIHST